MGVPPTHSPESTLAIPQVVYKTKKYIPMDKHITDAYIDKNMLASCFLRWAWAWSRRSSPSIPTVLAYFQPVE